MCEEIIRKIFQGEKSNYIISLKCVHHLMIRLDINSISLDLVA